MKDPHESKRLVEELNAAFERFGLPRIGSRIFTHLLLADQSEVPTDELASVLKASRGSVSTMTRLLIQMGIVERVGKPGDRRDYFRVKPGTWEKMMKARMDQMIELHDLLERGMTIVGSDSKHASRRLREMHEIYVFFEKEFPALFDRWQKYSGGKAGGSRKQEA